MLLPHVDKLSVGTIVKTHGIKGEMNVALDSAELDFDFQPGEPLILEIDGLDVPFFIRATRPRGAESLLLSLDGIDNETEASMLCGHTLFTYVDDESDADDEDSDDEEELTADDLVGYDIMDADHPSTLIGHINQIRELAADCWYFELADSGKLIPIADEFITAIDHQKRTVEMSLPQGLLEL
jgi:16S rRNA processing protein RimM